MLSVLVSAVVARDEQEEDMAEENLERGTNLIELVDFLDWKHFWLLFPPELNLNKLVDKSAVNFRE